MSDNPVRVPESECIPVGGPVEDARAAAVQAGVTAGAIGNDAQANRDDDVTRKGFVDQQWAQLHGVIENANPTQFAECQAAINTAATAIASEVVQITAGDEHLAVGQTLVTEGDNAHPMQAKIAKYNAAKDHYEAAESAFTTAGSAHGQADGALDTAENILEQYG